MKSWTSVLALLAAVGTASAAVGQTMPGMDMGH